MKQFIKKIWIFGAIFVTLVIVSVLSVEVMSNIVLKKKILNYPMESKIAKLQINNDNVNIIVAGDSRAERQVIPSILQKKLGYSAINIAVSSGDLISTSYAIDKYNDNNIFVISASSWQINDGAISAGYLSDKCFQELSLIEKSQMYYKALGKLFYLEKTLFLNTGRHFIKREGDKKSFVYDGKTIKAGGFSGVQGLLHAGYKNAHKRILNHPWYKNFHNNGARWRIFEKAFHRLGKREALIIIYQPPISPAWEKYTHNSIVSIAERQYSKKLKYLCSLYENIVCYDFYNNKIEGLNDEMYYDYQHLNETGAQIFSKILSDIISKEIKKQKHNKEMI